ncbi:hypothetical protein [Spiroplasma poulsonii]|uniref:hypothetical protein n=1 Tax=Spiroplasma poulsonii TaxID=2138 RepID=UPI001F4CFFA5|nr:hypothetical protein [Spiroplasma poulsonii]UNF62501.1 hypothetical protein MNU24_03315 [Spiroplasma poulsonii]
MTLLYWLIISDLFSFLGVLILVRLIITVILWINIFLIWKLWLTTCWVKALINDYFNDKTIIIDANENFQSNAQKDKKQSYSGKRKHTIKTHNIEQETKIIANKVFVGKTWLCLFEESKSILKIN